MRAVSLSIDLNERPDEPVELYKFATMVHVACGGRGVDERSMTRAVKLARESWAKISAHPVPPPGLEESLRAGTEVDPEMVRQNVRDQCASLLRVTGWLGARIYAVKPHRVLYEAMARDRRIADAVVDGAFEGLEMDIPVVGSFEGAMREYALQAALDYLREAFADEPTGPDGAPLSRTDPGALLADPAFVSEQALRLARSGRYDTIGLHSSSPNAVAVAGAARTALESQGLLSR
jgi:UPF0271 protein